MYVYSDLKKYHVNPIGTPNKDNINSGVSLITQLALDKNISSIKETNEKKRNFVNLHENLSKKLLISGSVEKIEKFRGIDIHSALSRSSTYTLITNNNSIEKDTNSKCVQIQFNENERDPNAINYRNQRNKGHILRHNNNLNSNSFNGNDVRKNTTNVVNNTYNNAHVINTYTNTNTHTNTYTHHTHTHTNTNNDSNTLPSLHVPSSPLKTIANYTDNNTMNVTPIKSTNIKKRVNIANSDNNSNNNNNILTKHYSDEVQSPYNNHNTHNNDHQQSHHREMKILKIYDKIFDPKKRNFEDEISKKKTLKNYQLYREAKLMDKNSSNTKQIKEKNEKKDYELIADELKDKLYFMNSVLGYINPKIKSEKLKYEARLLDSNIKLKQKKNIHDINMKNRKFDFLKLKPRFMNYHKNDYEPISYVKSLNEKEFLKEKNKKFLVFAPIQITSI